MVSPDEGSYSKNIKASYLAPELTEIPFAKIKKILKNYRVYDSWSNAQVGEAVMKMQIGIRKRQDPKHVVRNIFGGTFGAQLVEQISDSLLFHITPASDIFSLGLLFAQILVHKKIELESFATMEAFNSFLRSEIKPISTITPTTNQPLISLIEHCMEQDSSRRPSAEEISIFLNSVV